MRQKINLEYSNCEICKKKNSEFFTSSKDYSYETTNLSFDYYFCKNCNVLYLNNRPKFTSYKIIYNERYKAYKKSIISFFFLFATYIGNYLKINFFKKNLSKNDKILEIGTGNGQLLSIIKSKLKTLNLGIEIIEKDKNVIKKLKKSGFKVNENYFEFAMLKPNTYKLIIMNQVIEHLKYPNQCFKKLNKIIKKNGILFIETPTIDSIKKIREKSLWGGLHAPRHMYIYNKTSLIKLLRKNGFKKVSSKYIISPYLLYETFKANLIRLNLSFLCKFISVYNPVALLIYILIEYYNLYILQKYSNMQIIFKKV